MIPIPKSALGIAAGISGLLFVGYCVYFDRRRHSDPNFKKNLREKRKKNRQSRLAGTKIPDLRTQDAVQKFFLSEVQLGEELLQQGDIDGAVEHLGSAIAVCGQPSHLLHIFQSTLPPQVFHILLQRLPMIGQSVQARHKSQFGVEIGTAGPAPPSGGGGFPGGMMMGGPMPGMEMPGGDSLGPSFLTLDEELE